MILLLHEVKLTIPSAETKQAQILNRKISKINGRIKEEESADPSVVNSLYSQLDSARSEYQSFQDALYVTHPELRVGSGHTPTLRPDDIDTLTRDRETAYVEYVVSKGQVHLFVLTASRSNMSPDLKVYPIVIDSEVLARKVNEFHQRLANKHPDFANAAQELYGLLIKPAADQLRGTRTLCIVPDGFLWELPFQALITANDRYLLEDYALYYAPSLTVLREMAKQKSRNEKTNEELIAFGNPVIGKDNKRDADICPLPEAETEVAAISKIFSPQASKVFIGREASEKSFKALAPSYSTIHLATHGVIDNKQPLYSHLLLTKTDGDAENDGLLEGREIMNMKLDADLAILSACETGNGKISPGEGIIGMSWAFFVAGTRSMLVSQWKVNSASTSELMVSFYRARKKGQPGEKARALREAAMRTMRDQRYRHPLYWAGFVLVGSNQ